MVSEKSISIGGGVFRTIISILFPVMMIGSELSCVREHGAYLIFTIPSQVSVAALSPDGTRLAVGLDNYSIQILDTNTGKILHEFSGIHTNPIVSLVWSPNGSKLVSTADRGNTQNQVVLWDVQTQEDPWVLPRSKYVTNEFSTAFSNDGRFLIHRYGNIYVWDVETRTLVRHHDRAGSAPVLSKNGTTLLFVGFRPNLELCYTHPEFDYCKLPAKVVYLWNFTTEQEKILEADDEFVSATYSADESHVLTIEQGQTSQLGYWDVQSQTRDRLLELAPIPDKRTALTYEFSDDRKRLLINWSKNYNNDSLTRIATVWNLETGKEMTHLDSLSVYSKAYFAQSDGSQIYSFTTDAKKPFPYQVRLWNSESSDSYLHLLTVVNSDSGETPAPLIPTLTKSSDGSRLMVSYSIVSGTILHVWDLNHVSL